MYKIKLLTLLLVSLINVSCIENKTSYPNIKYSLAYIGGEFEGLILKNYLMNYLSSYNLYDKNSNFEIVSNISHSDNLYITNIDNTSDRTNIQSTLNVEIRDKENNCPINNFYKSVSQFYIFADGSKYLSNNTAVEKIKKENTEVLVKSFINNLGKVVNKCEKAEI